jgi:hypothetical protein
MLIGQPVSERVLQQRCLLRHGVQWRLWRVQPRGLAWNLHCACDWDDVPGVSRHVRSGGDVQRIIAELPDGRALAVDDGLSHGGRRV